MRETWVRSLCWEDPLQEGMAIHSSILAWRIPMDSGACRAIVHGVAKSWTQLSEMEKQWKQWEILFSWAPKSLQMVTAAMKKKTLALWKKSYDQPRQHIKSRDITLPTKARLVKAMVFPVVMHGRESWKRSWCWERLKAKGEEGSITDSMDINLSKRRRQWRTGKPGITQSMESPRVRRDLVTE